MRLLSTCSLAAALFVHASLAAAEPPRITATSDAEIMGLLMALDQNEVEVAAAAQKKHVTGPVLELAQNVRQDHDKNIKATKELGAKIRIAPKRTEAVNQLRAKGTAELDDLKPLNGETFSKAFVTAMVEGHREALVMLDNFFNVAQNEELKRHLSDARQRIALHLQEAEKLKIEKLKT